MDGSSLENRAPNSGAAMPSPSKPAPQLPPTLPSPPLLGRPGASPPCATASPGGQSDFFDSPLSNAARALELQMSSP